MATFLIIVGAIAIWVIYGVATDDKKMKNRMKDTIAIDQGKYISGFKDIYAGSDVIYEIQKDKLKLFLDNRNNPAIKIIDFKDITDIKLVTKEFVKQKVSLGKFLLFGAFSLAMKESVLEYDSYLGIVLNSDEDGMIVVNLKDNLKALNKTVETMSK